MERIIKQSETLGLTHCVDKLKQLIETEKVFFDNPLGNALKYSFALKSMPDIQDKKAEFKNNAAKDNQGATNNKCPQNRAKSVSYHVFQNNRLQYQVLYNDYGSK